MAKVPQLLPGEHTFYALVAWMIGVTDLLFISVTNS